MKIDRKPPQSSFKDLITILFVITSLSLIGLTYYEYSQGLETYKDTALYSILAVTLTVIRIIMLKRTQKLKDKRNK